ncbi:SMP-30/gluconolactonase/LRE family protein [Acetobacteraceae bacterium ESL0709]|nr:SMP-30/gluconolactonase/LRE family protein [Acetobacteraceae bacterium ESL0697]MDF7677714.1 SMP-30/gluconolactonase/LRE family protein [Acetobacteraceae bacterium ESL0709]
MTFAFNQPHCVLDLKAKLGEGPLWSHREEALYFVDILGQKLHRYHPGREELTGWDVASHAAFILPVNDGSFLVGQTEGLYHFVKETGEFSLVCKIGNEEKGTRLNDGCVDPSGRVWFGTMDLGEEKETGAVFCLGYCKAGPELRCVDKGYIVSNGPAVSPDGRRLYVADSPRQCIYIFDLDDLGNLSHKRVFARFTNGYPDGLVTDSQGNLWCGVWGGGRIARFRPDGKALPPVPMPVSNVTKICFGGADYRTVYVTTARNGLSEEELRNEPQAGGVFAFRTGIPGWASPGFPVMNDCS